MYLEDLDEPTIGVWPMPGGPFHVVYDAKGNPSVWHHADRQLLHSLRAQDLMQPKQIADYLRGRIVGNPESIPYIDDEHEKIRTENQILPFYRIKGSRYLISLNPFYVTDMSSREISIWTIRCIEALAKDLGNPLRAIRSILVSGIN